MKLDKGITRYYIVAKTDGSEVKKHRAIRKMRDNLECYGRYSAGKEECLKCRYAEYCRSAKDPAQISYENFDKAVATPAEDRAIVSFDEPLEGLKYTSEQVCFVIHRLLTLDDSTFRILRLKILSPTITDEQIGRAFKISRQAVSKQFKQFSILFPQFSRLLNPGVKIIRRDAEKCLMEANKCLVNGLKIINGGGSMDAKEKYNSRMRQRSLETNVISERHERKRAEKRERRKNNKKGG